MNPGTVGVIVVVAGLIAAWLIHITVHEKKIKATTVTRYEAHVRRIEDFERQHPEFSGGEVIVHYAKHIRANVPLWREKYGIVVDVDASEILYRIVAQEVISELSSTLFIGNPQDMKFIYDEFCKCIGDRWR